MASMTDFLGKIAIVTAGASGIGAAAARLFAKRGGMVVIADIDPARGKAIAGEIGKNALFMRCDAGDIDSATTVIEETVARFGKIDCLLNNAGVAAMSTTPDLDAAEWRKVIDLTLNSVYFFSHAAIPHLRAGGGGVILNTASVSGMCGDYMMAAYNAAKGGVINFTRAMALDHAIDNIRVNAVCPGMIRDTAMTQPLADLPGGWEPWNKAIPMGRGGDAIEVARVMMFLLSDDASYMTGAVVPVDGGLTAHTGFPDLRPLLCLKPARQVLATRYV